MEFNTPWLIVVALVGALLWIVDFWNWGKRSPFVFPLSSAGVKRPVQLIRSALFLAGLVGWGMLSFAIMQPRTSQKISPQTRKVNDIFFVLDISRSMLAIDLPPNRLEVAKKKIQQFVDLRPQDRIGVVVFSEKVFTLLPLTTDNDLVKKMVAKIEVGFLGSGTNMGDALALAVGRAAESETKNKVIILLTDGVNNVGNMDPIQAAELAKDNRMKVYTIGIGTDDSARLPIGRGVFGTQYQMIPGGSIDLKTLETISQTTGAKSYVARSEGALEEILQEIERLERTDIKTRSQVVYNEHYYFYLLMGVGLLGVAEGARRFVLREFA